MTTNSKLGIAGLTPDHHARWAAGLASLREIGEELGVRPQTIHKALRHRGWDKTNAPAIQPPAAAPVAAPVAAPPVEQTKASEWLGDIEKDTIAARAHRTLIMGGLILADEATAGLKTGKGRHSASSLNGYARALTSAAELLSDLLRPIPKDEADQLPELRVRVLSDAEHLDLKRNGVRRDEDDIDGDYGDDLEADGLGTAVGLGIAAGKAGSTSGPGIAAVGRSDTSPSTSPQPPTPTAPPARPAGPSLPPLPSKDGYRDWLAALGNAHGRRWLREIASSVSGREVGAGVDMGEVVEIIVHATGGDPVALKVALDKLNATTA
jgi:hypothetical protein